MDNSPLADFPHYVIDMEELARSALKADKYYIFTCECGHPECRQLYTPVTIKYHSNYVSWHIMEPGPERILNFEIIAYRKMAEEILTTSLFILKNYHRKFENLDWQILPYRDNWNLSTLNKQLARLQQLLNPKK